MSTAKQTHPSASRNSEPIANALQGQLDAQTTGLKLLEIASGSGQHAGYLAPLFANVTFQPTEVDTSHFASIKAYAADCPTKNIRDPIALDISEDVLATNVDNLKPGSFDYLFNSNMMHISPWRCSVGLFRAAGVLLRARGLMFTYGPYAVDGVLEPESNINFDQSLRTRNPEWGVRDIKDLKVLAEENGLQLQNTVEMPSNNKLLTWVKL